MRELNSTQESGLQIKIPWDKITARSFAAAVLINAVLLYLFFTYIDMNVEPPKSRRTTIPTEIIYGELNGSLKPQGGNLARQGEARKGVEAAAPLEDAQASSSTRVRQDVVQTENRDAYPNPVKEIASKNPKQDSSDARQGNRDVGVPNAENTKSRGLGDFGSGVGKGLGIGDIEWGGGGNRIVLDKPLPKYPRGVDRNTQIRCKFFVEPNGTVSKVIPVQRGEPRLEKEAVDALKRWRFNTTDSNEQMVGYITFTFQIQ